MMGSKENILKTAVTLFSRQGFDGVSMRKLAKSANMSTAAVYHHFPNKQALYLQAMHFAFAKQQQAFDQVWQADLEADEKLSRFVRCLAEVLTTDVDFRRFMQRELLDADDGRMQLLAKQVFQEQFKQLMAVIEQKSGSQQQAHFSALSVISLVCDIIQMQPLSRHLPGWKKEHEQVDFIACQVLNLLMNGIKSKGSK
ncbi:TetR/AcrR family transcriptional regulator [Bathymodiolus japonicus methanotrophic gill symbiont]|uniref:TetR/AcrR family transcriptional regulator n=1 Tax=Bathymodiolus japonicus methanotrophic gill symbiont TaxID=113269 RepID=UPI001B5EA566|nr:TetR/AcrR family transcriptional regulator [Bathymodiolus japonicus methanotrophic gill symbiont]GFO71775.1 TetR/AcrR family transcriptional regulator [Bathymodiolus japonicus methanotrophic gill symbiont]